MRDTNKHNGDISDLGFDTEYQNKRFLIRSLYGVAVPVVSAIAVIDIMTGRYLLAASLAIILTVLFIALLASYRKLTPRREYAIYIWTLTILNIMVGIICLYTIGLNAEISRLPWAYLYVVLVINTYRFKMSLIWTGLFIILLLLVILIQNTPGRLQHHGFLLRFVGTYVFLTFSIGLIKHKREQIQGKFVKHHQVLQASESRLREINTRLTEEIENRIQTEQALRQSEEQLARELTEKDVLIKEIHHRVKNNMQIISSLLRLQSQNESSEETKAAFQEAINRIAAMAMVHEEIYRSDSLAVIDLGTYITSLTNGILGSSELARKPISLNINVEKEIHVTPSFAVPFGLALNELITNAIKHAFPDDGCGELHISTKKGDDQSIEISVADNGIGLPQNFDPQNTETLGIYLIYRLIEGQLHGTIQINRQQGTEFKITVKTGGG